MSEKTKREKHKAKNETEEFGGEKKQIADEGDWSKDQQEKSYYYDDSYGYEIYNAENDEDE